MVISFLANIFFFVDSFSNQKNLVDQPAIQYPYLARRIFAESPNDVIINFVPLRQKLREYVVVKEGKIGIFFEYLPTGIGIGVNDREAFFRASLVKVPGVMSAYKLIEEGKLTRREQLTVQEYHLDSDYGSLWQQGAGTTISVEEAMRLSLVESDNTAYEVLNEKINEILDADIGEEQNIDDVYDYLDILRDEEGLTQEITPRNYSSILRSLFFSAYLSYENSNELLDILTRTAYIQGITKSLPDSVKVAHKFGIHNVEPGNLDVHSDCGIIYFPQRPYILCVMVASGDEARTSKYIQEISRMVYDYISGVN